MSKKIWVKYKKIKDYNSNNLFKNENSWFFNCFMHDDSVYEHNKRISLHNISQRPQCLTGQRISNGP